MGSEMCIRDSPDSDHALFEVDCGKGTYVRSIARDLGAALGCYGYVSLLRRTKVGPFTLENAISLDSLAQIVHSDALSESLLPIKTVLDDISALALTAEESRKIRHGMPLSRTDLEPTAVTLLMDGDSPLALATVDKGQVKPFRVFNL